MEDQSKAPTDLSGRSDPPGDRALKSSHSIDQRIFETLLDLLLVVDRRGRIVRVSPSSATILGRLPGEMIGKIGAEFIFPADLESTREEMRLARRGRLTRNFDCRYLHADGRIVPLAWTGIWSEVDEQHFFIGRDMTDRIAAEERLRHAQRLEAIGQLTGGIAHDFNNLLSIIIGRIDFALDRAEIGAEAREHCNAALHAAQSGAELTRRLLAFARQQPLEPRTVDTNALAGNIVSLLARTLGQNIEVQFEGAEAIWPVSIDPANLESAIANLAVNARDAMPEGGRLIIQTQNAILDDEYARVNPEAEPGEYVAIVVTDTGTGMPPDVLDRIFEPFFTTKEQGKGTGLGLSTVFGFVKQSGGHIKAYSELGHGTSFRLYLPRAEGPPQTEPDGGSAEQALGAQPHETILVVEDSDAIRQLVLIQLARLGYETLEANGAPAALELLESGVNVDLLFTDVIMPGGMDGHALAREATARQPQLKVLFTSGFPGARLAAAGGVGDGEAVLSKPYRVQELALKLRQLLDQ